MSTLKKLFLCILHRLTHIYRSELDKLNHKTEKGQAIGEFNSPMQRYRIPHTDKTNFLKNVEDNLQHELCIEKGEYSSFFHLKSSQPFILHILHIDHENRKLREEVASKGETRDLHQLEDKTKPFGYKATLTDGEELFFLSQPD